MKKLGCLEKVSTEWLHEFAEAARAELAGEISQERREFVVQAKDDMEAEMRRRGKVLRAINA